MEFLIKSKSNLRDTTDRVEQNDSTLQFLFPLVLEQRPGKILGYDLTTNSVTWIWQSYNADGDRINHPNGLMGTPVFMPGKPVGNADFSLVTLPVEAWFRKRLTSPTFGPVYEFDANCCPPPGPPASGGAPACCNDTSDITLHIAGSSDCCDGLPTTVTLTWDVDSQRWKGSYTCTIGYCTITVNFMLQCYSCANPPKVPDCSGLDCSDDTNYYYCLTWWTTGNDVLICPSNRYGTISWAKAAITCGPITLPGQTIDLGLGCTLFVSVGGGPFDPPCGLAKIYLTATNPGGECPELTPTTLELDFDAGTGIYSIVGATLTGLTGTVDVYANLKTSGTEICPEGEIDFTIKWSCRVPAGPFSATDCFVSPCTPSGFVSLTTGPGGCGCTGLLIVGSTITFTWSI